MKLNQATVGMFIMIIMKMIATARDWRDRVILR
jgi:hypothetical protein